MFPLDNLELTIDSIYKQLLTNLRKDGRIEDTSALLLSVPETYKKVFFVYDLIKAYGLIPLIVKEDKCEFASLHYRNLGNLLYTRGDLCLAWQYYNLAMMYSPLHSTSYSIAISNRSAVLAALRKYKECLEDIKMVFSLECPSDIRDKLLKRMRRCEEALQIPEDPEVVSQNEHIDDIFTFKGTLDEQYLDASSKLEVKSSPQMGRHVVAKEDIEVGEIIVQEDPYVKVLLRSQVMIACGHCFSRSFNLYPCPYCCLTMYCSRSCVEKAWHEYHYIECPLIAGLVKMNCTKLEWLAMRTTIKARRTDSSWKNVLEAMEEVESVTTPEEMGCLITENDDLVYSSKYYHSVHCLETNVKQRDVSDIFQKTVSAAVLMHFICVANFVQVDDPVLKRRIKIFTANTLMKHMMTAPTNMHGITACAQDGEANYVAEYNIGSGAYSFLSLINHSCTPNVVRFTRLGTSQIHLFALRPIKKGMQIVDNYGFFEGLRDEEQVASPYVTEIKRIARCLHCSSTSPGIPPRKAHHAVHTREDRQAILKNQYKFICMCEACIGDWPLYHNLQTAQFLPAPIPSKVYECLNQNVIEALQKGDRKRALKVYKPLCELATALEPYLPCKEAAECQEALKQCLSIFAGTIPFILVNHGEWEIPAPKAPGLPTSSRFYAGVGAFGLLDDI